MMQFITESTEKHKRQEKYVTSKKVCFTIIEASNKHENAPNSRGNS